jgi:acyl carrier protein
MSTKDEIFMNTLIETISKYSGFSKVNIRLNSKLIEDLSYNELDTSETVMDLEDKLNIEIDDDVFEKLKTVKEVYDYLLKCKNYEGYTADSTFPLEYNFTGHLLHENFEGSECARIDCGTDISITIDKYDIRKNDTIFPDILESFKDKKVKVTIELI